MSQAGYTPIQLYYSTTAAATPSAGNLAAGELAVNITDGKLFYKDNGGVVRVLATAAGSAGDVVGPGSSTDNALVRFDGTTGKLVQSSVGVLSDAGALSGLTSVAATTFTGTLTGNASTATTLQTSRTIWGQSFDGSANVTGALTGVTDLTASGSLTLNGGTANGISYLNGSKVLTSGSALTFDGTNLGFGGTGQRITGDFSNATVANRVMFQTSTVNGQTSIGVLPNGTSTIANINLFGGIDTANASIGQLVNTGTEVRLGAVTTGTGTYLPMTFYTGGSERMRVDTSGNVGIGTSSPTVYGSYRTLEVLGTGGGLLQLGTGATTAAYLYQDGTNAGFNNIANGVMTFGTNNTERMRIDSSGNLLVGTTTVRGGVTSGTNAWRFGGDASDTNPGAFRHVAGGSTRIEIYGNGNIANSNGVYGSFSDAKLKENVTDATPKLDKLQQVRIVNYNLIGDEQKQLGVIAQELEQIFPSMVDSTPDCDDEGNDLGTVTKSVKYSVFVPMLIKAIQEQQAIIEQLKADVAALKGN